MKKKSKIKYENIIVVLMVMVEIISLFTHIKTNGIYFELILEIITSIIFISFSHFIAKTYRLNKKYFSFYED